MQFWTATLLGSSVLTVIANHYSRKWYRKFEFFYTQKHLFLKNLYENINNAYRVFLSKSSDYSADGQQEQLEKAKRYLVQTIELFEKNRLYLDPLLDERIDTFLISTVGAINKKICVLVDHHNDALSEGKFKSIAMNFIVIESKYKNETKKLLEKINKTFKKDVGSYGILSSSFYYLRIFLLFLKKRWLRFLRYE